MTVAPAPRKVVVVVPFLNEEENLPALYERLARRARARSRRGSSSSSSTTAASDGSAALGRAAAPRATRA